LNLNTEPVQQISYTIIVRRVPLIKIVNIYCTTLVTARIH